MTLGQLRELTKDLPDNTVILAYDRYQDDESNPPVILNGIWQSGSNPDEYMRYVDRILPTKEFEKEMEFMGEVGEAIILRI